MKRKSPDVPLEANDVLYIPDNTRKKAAMTALEKSAFIGGAIGGWAWGLWKKLPCAPGADAAAFGMLVGLAIGRIGDLINGEHFAKPSSLPWALTYSNPNSPAFARRPMQPAVEYEALMDLVILGVLAFLWRRHPKSRFIR